MVEAEPGGIGLDRARRRRLGARRAVAARPGDRACRPGGSAKRQVRDMLGIADRGLVFDLFESVLRGDAAAALAQLDRALSRGAPTRCWCCRICSISCIS